MVTIRTLVVCVLSFVLATPIGWPGVYQPIDSTYFYGNPAGCKDIAPTTLEEMLDHTQDLLGSNFVLDDYQQHYIWNAFSQSFENVTNNQFVREYQISKFASSSTLLWNADRLVTAFLVSGFVAYTRNYGGMMRVTAIPMIDGVKDSDWYGYIEAYWNSKESQPPDDTIVPQLKKLPCKWVVDKGYVSSQNLVQVVPLSWQKPNYALAGSKYLANTCDDAYKMASTIPGGTRDGSTTCGPLVWAILTNTNSFPYRIGGWYGKASVFVGTNPRFNAKPWSAFPPDTFELTQHKIAMNRVNFDITGQLLEGDVLFSYGSMYTGIEGKFSHIFMVTEIGADQERYSISNLVRNWPYSDCSISRIRLYTPGDRETGFINFEWNNGGFGHTGGNGYDVFRWNWITFHQMGAERSYVVRLGDTLDTIAFDWKLDPLAIAENNNLTADDQLIEGNILLLPAPQGDSD